MADLLLELFSEEIPARMQRKAAEDLRRLVTDALVAQGLLYEGAKAYATPRRLALHVVGLPAKGQDVREEKKGPRVGAPQAAIDGFVRSAGLTSIEQVKVQASPKGDFYVALIETPGRETKDVIAEIVPGIVKSFPWPKSMRWGAASREGGALRWVRPLQSIVATLGSENVDAEVIDFEVGGIRSGDTTYGHRFLAPGAIRVKRFDDYVAALDKAKVVLDADRRKDIILTDARNLAFAQGLDLVEDEGLLEEVAGLVEQPVVLMGAFDEAFLDIPAEAIRATIRANQKCFVLKKPDGGLANRFILVSNLIASDDGKAIVAGNERVVRARLSDAKFFWETDRKVPLDERLEKLKSIVFHEKLGTQHERVERIAALARELAPVVGADPDKAERAARLAKADLVTEMVGEFPELQGLMGRYYAAQQGEDASVAAAIEEHYKPQGPSDRVPTDPVSIAVALADKLDTLVGFWAIDEKPTGSKDPYALRRAALGVVRIIVDNELRTSLARMSAIISSRIAVQAYLKWVDSKAQQATILKDIGISDVLISELKEEIVKDINREDAHTRIIAANQQASFEQAISLIQFFGDRIKNQLRSEGASYEHVDAVFGDGVQDDLLLIVRRVEALGRFLDTEDGRNLLAGVKRASNILKAEEKKDGEGAFDDAYDLQLIASAGQIEEKALAVGLANASGAVQAAVGQEDFEGAMKALAELRPAVDAFFDMVTVNADDPAIRANRLKLLSALRAATREVADFSRIGG